MTSLQNRSSGSHRVIDRLRGEQLRTSSHCYRVGRELGRGGNGVVFVCNAPGTEDIVAKIYIPPDSRDLDDRTLERFRMEIALTSKILHPNIVRSLDDGTVELGTYTLPFAS